MLPTKLDHCVIHVSEWERSNTFYTEVGNVPSRVEIRSAGVAV